MLIGMRLQRVRVWFTKGTRFGLHRVRVLVYKGNAF